MKRIYVKMILSLFIFGSFSGYAKTYKYDCVHQKDYSDKLEIKVSKKKMTLLHNSVDGARANVVYLNQGILGGQGRMKNRLYFTADDESSDVSPQEGFEYFYISPALTTGGFTFRNGSKGGYLTFNGQVYSYETYICFLNQ